MHDRPRGTRCFLILLGAIPGSMLDEASTRAQLQPRVQANADLLQSADRSAWKIKRATQAGDCALRLAGLKSDVAASAKLVTLENDETPFLADKLNGRDVWMVTVPDWSVELKSAPAKKDSYRRTLDMIIEPATGGVVKVRTRWPENVPEPKDTVEPDARTAEEQILPERYHGFPVQAPPLSFLEALDGYWGEAALVAKRIDGLWVLYSRMDSQEPRPVWVITLWSIPPIPVFRGDADVPGYLRENLRFVVDPANKEGWMMTSQSPHRVPVKEGKDPDKENQ